MVAFGLRRVRYPGVGACKRSGARPYAVAATGDIYYGLWYPIVVAIMTLIIGALFLTETRERDIRTYDHSMLP